MSRVIPVTACRPLAKAFTANNGATSFAGKTALVTTRPSGTGVVNFEKDEPTSSKWIFYGTGSANQTFDFCIWGWSASNPDGTWIPVLLFQGTATLSTFAGVTSGIVTASELIADTITVASGYGGTAGIDYEIITPGGTPNNTPAMLLLNNKGCLLLELELDMTGATNGNALVAGV